MLYKLKKIGTKNKNSTSYKIKNTQRRAKFTLICKFKSEMLLKPHS